MPVWLKYRPQVGNCVASLSTKVIIDSDVARGAPEGFAVAQGIDIFSVKDLLRLEEMAQQMAQFAQQGQRKALIDTGHKVVKQEEKEP